MANSKASKLDIAQIVESIQAQDSAPAVEVKCKKAKLKITAGTAKPLRSVQEQRLSADPKVKVSVSKGKQFKITSY